MFQVSLHFVVAPVLLAAGLVCVPARGQEIVLKQGLTTQTPAGQGLQPTLTLHAQKHELRASLPSSEYVPLSYDRAAAGSERIAYRYALIDRPEATIRFGFGSRFRAAFAERSFYGERIDPALPFVHASVERRFGERWSVVADVDAMTTAPGRGLDVGVSVGYSLDRNWSLLAAYRSMDPGLRLPAESSASGRANQFTFGAARSF